jgi:hypothetical protein
MRISAFIASHYKAGCQPWEVLAIADDPGAQNGGCSLCGGQFKAQFINVAEAVVTAMDGLSGAGGGSFEGRSQRLRIRQR